MSHEKEWSFRVLAYVHTLEKRVCTKYMTQYLVTFCKLKTTIICYINL